VEGNQAGLWVNKKQFFVIICAYSCADVLSLWLLLIRIIDECRFAIDS